MAEVYKNNINRVINSTECTLPEKVTFPQLVKILPASYKA